MTDKTTRVQLELPPKSMEKLVLLKQEMECSSYSEVIKTSLRVLDYIHSAQQNGAKILIQNSDGSVVNIIIV